jgi:hypothetical protein
MLKKDWVLPGVEGCIKSPAFYFLFVLQSKLVDILRVWKFVELPVLRKF